MGEKDNFQSEANATHRRWQKYRDEDEKKHQAGVQGLHTFIEEALKNDKIRQKVSVELKEIRQSGNRPRYQTDAGYNIVKDDYDETVDGSF